MAAIIDGHQNRPVLTIDSHQEIKQCRRHAAKSRKEAHLQVVGVDLCKKVLQQRSILGLQPAKTYAATAAVNDFGAFP
jgi:hypothetical protein